MLKLRDGAVRHITQARCCVEDCPNIRSVEGEWTDFPEYVSLPHNKQDTDWVRVPYLYERDFGIGRYALFCPDHAPEFQAFHHSYMAELKGHRERRKTWWTDPLRAFTERFFTQPKPLPSLPFQRTEKMRRKR